MIEHLSEQAQVLDEIARVLRPEGVLIISTPDRRAQAESGAPDNPFHARELSREEFAALLGTQFPNLALWGQRTEISGSVLSQVQGQSGEVEAPRTFFVQADGDSFSIDDDFVPMYLVAVASPGRRCRRFRLTRRSPTLRSNSSAVLSEPPRIRYRHGCTAEAQRSTLSAQF